MTLPDINAHSSSRASTASDQSFRARRLRGVQPVRLGDIEDDDDGVFPHVTSAEPRPDGAVPGSASPTPFHHRGRRIYQPRQSTRFPADINEPFQAELHQPARIATPPPGRIRETNEVQGGYGAVLPPHLRRRQAGSAPPLAVNAVVPLPPIANVSDSDDEAGVKPLPVLRVIDCDRYSATPTDFKRRITWEIEGGPVEDLQMWVEMRSPVDDTVKTDRYFIPGKDANAVPPVPIEIAHLQVIRLFLIGNDFFPSNTLEIPVDATVAARPGGGPLRNLLNHHEVRKNDERTKMQYFDDGMFAINKRKLKYRAYQLINAAAEYLLPDHKLLKGTRFKQSQLRDRSKVLQESIEEAGIDTSMLSMISSALPVIGQIKAGAKAGVFLVLSGIGAWRSTKMFRIEKRVGKFNTYAERPRTAMTVLGRLQNYNSLNALNKLEKSVSSFFEFALRSGAAFGFGTVVGTGFTIRSFVRHVIERYLDKRRVEITNLKLTVCRETGSPAAYYDVIENGHICVATHVVDNYSGARLTGTEQVFHPFDKVANKLRKEGKYLKEQAEKIKKDQRFHVAPLQGDYGSASSSGSRSGSAAAGEDSD